MVCVQNVLAQAGKKHKEGEKSSYEKEQKLFHLYQNIEDLLAGFEEYVEEARADTECSKAKIATMIEQVACTVGKNQQKNDPGAIETQMAPAPTPQAISRASTAVHAAYKASAHLQDLREAEESATALEEKKAPVPYLHIVEKRDDDAVPTKVSEKVMELSKHGYCSSEIAQHLGISVREVTLAMNLIKTY